MQEPVTQYAAPPVQQPATAATEAAAVAARRIAPLWPLKHFVAVNPFIGLEDRPFSDAAETLARAAGARLTMPRGFYADAIAGGRITDADLAGALADAGRTADLPGDAAGLRAAALAAEPAAPRPLPTLADVASEATGRDWARLATERIAAWAAAYFDRGQAAWRSPWRDRSAFAAWRGEAVHDRAPELAGVSGFRATVGALPADPGALTAEAARRLGIPAAGLERYFHGLLMSIGGWAGYARYRAREQELRGGTDSTVEEVLAVRLAWEVALFEAFPAVRGPWERARERLADPGGAGRALAVDTVLQSAYERAWQRRLVATFDAPAGDRAALRERAPLQAAFCIDVRSEVYRRALEAAAPGSETIGFAGFFGLPVDYRPLGADDGRAQCPALLTPAVTVRERVKDASAEEEAGLQARRVARLRAAKAWKSFKLAAVSSFSFVEAMGLGYTVKLLTDSLGVTRPVRHPDGEGLGRGVAERLRPELDPGAGAGAETAAAILRGMSLTDDFARLVLLAGHGASTVNNPHATGLDCGACGGHSGEVNARVAAALLNDPGVRSGLAGHGIEIPEDTVFVAALHDTTTDEVAVLDEDAVPESHAGDLAWLKRCLAEAGRRARRERAPALDLASAGDVDRAIARRSTDWSQVRPEWGLAGCAAFVAAPRHRTRGRDLGGRAFLHSYDWHTDDGFAVLETIMTAPMVVASWISLQYYGSAVDNRVFGAGNKVLHNVTGTTVGVLEGNGGDLRTGLPLQSVHDGEALVHDPVRLSVLVEAPMAAMNGVIARNESVRRLVDNGWVHLFAMDPTGRVSHRYAGGLVWRPVTDERLSAAA